jgi:DNA-binding phage protein
MNINKIKQAMQSLNLKQVSRDTGINHNTLLAIKNSPEANPTLNTLQTLDAYIKRLAGGAND